MNIIHTYKSAKEKMTKYDGQREVKHLVLHYTSVPFKLALATFVLHETTDKYSQDLKDLKEEIESDEDLLNIMAKLVNLKGNETEINSLKFIQNMSKRPVSSHYLLKESGDIYSLVDENNIAHHAGKSYWSGQENINQSSIGVHLTNIGFKWLANYVKNNEAKSIAGTPEEWFEFEESQIDALIPLLKEIIERHDIKPWNVVGNFDIVTMARKVDPGPRFPWKKLYDNGIGMWFDLDEASPEIKELFDSNDTVAIQDYMVNKLNSFGYNIKQRDSYENEEKFVKELSFIVRAFQAHFLPELLDGEIHLNAMQAIDSLCKRKQNLIELEATKKVTEHVNRFTM